MKNSPSPNSLAVVALLLAAVGVPSAVSFFFIQTIIQHPWQACGILLLYEIVVVIVGFVSNVWQELANNWAKQIAKLIDVRVQGFLSGYQKHYCEYLRYQHRDFDVKGLNTQGIYTLDLEQVFVELSIDPKPVHQTSPDPLKIPEELHKGGHFIWDYLMSEALIKQHLVIIGAPGSGKTTLLKYMTLTLVAQKKDPQQLSVPQRLPFLLFLRDHVDALKENSKFSLVDAVEAHLNKWKRPVPSGWVEHRLTRGHCLVLLDGLDEVADPEVRQHMVDWVEQQMVAYGKNRFIITSRPFGYRSNPLSKVTVLEVQPFTPVQVKQFVHNWYIANEIMSMQKNDPGVLMKAKDGAEDLLQRLHNTPALFALAVNPLLLTMIATVHRYRSSLPGKRVALYAEICEVFLGKRQEAKRLKLDLSPAQKLRVLQPLAYYMMLHEMKEIPSAKAQEVIVDHLKLVNRKMQPTEFLQLVENTSGVMLEREQGVYCFAHLTFQEYLAATYIRDHRLEDMLVAQVEASWWHETIRLYCAQADATPIIAACIAGDRSSLSALSLAIDCQKEAFEVQSTVSAQLDTLIERGVEDANIERRLIVTEAMLAKRLQQMLHLNEETYGDISLITCAEYQLFLDDQRVRGVNYLPDHWSDDHFPPTQGLAPILGVRPSDAMAFCTWLTERYSGAWRYRLPKSNELDKELKGENAAIGLVAGTGYWINEGKKFVWVSRGSLNLIDITQKQSNPDNAISRAIARAFDGNLQSDPAIINRISRDFTITRTITTDSTIVRELSDKLTIVVSRDLASDLANAFAREHDLATVPPQARQYARNLDRAFTLASALARAIKNDFVLANTSDYDLANALGIERDISLDRARARTSASARILAINRTLTLAIDRVLDQIRGDTLAINCYPVSTSNFNHILSHSFASALPKSLASALLRDTASSLDAELTDVLTNVRDFMPNTAHDIPGSHSNGRELASFFRWYIRLLAGVLALYLLYWPRSNRKQESENIQYIIDRYLDIFFAFALLEERIQGTLRACEGILIVKETKKEKH